MIEYWTQNLERSWGIKARLSALDGEFDLNIKAESADGKRYLLKIMRKGCDVGLVNMQCEAIQHIHASAISVNVPFVVPSKSGRNVESLADEAGNARLVWVLSFLDGIHYASFTPKSSLLIADLGRSIARLHLALEGFDHPALQREFKWNLTQAFWINDQLDVITDSDRRALLKAVMDDYQQILDSVKALPSRAIHNDINDYNLLAHTALNDAPVISGIVDFGDMCAAPTVCDLAIAGAYIMLDQPQPDVALSALVAAYHAVLPLTEHEIELIFPLALSRLAVSVVNSTIEALAKPDDPYVVISQAPAWRLLENSTVNHSLVTARLRVACGLPICESAARVEDYLVRQVRGNCAAVIGMDLSAATCHSLSAEQCSVPQNPFELTMAEAITLGDDSVHESLSALAGDNADEPRVWLGYYNEPRLIYTDSAFRNGAWKASNRRTVHLGVDVFSPAGTNVHAPLDAVVCVIENRPASLDYGGMVVLEHKTPCADRFYSLYGHLDPDSIQTLRPGQSLNAGDVFAALGTPAQNGGWTPHLHMQLAMCLDGYDKDWPGVADPDDLAFWNAMCPNPAALLNLPDEKVGYASVDESLVLQHARLATSFV